MMLILIGDNMCCQARCYVTFGKWIIIWGYVHVAMAIYVLGAFDAMDHKLGGYELQLLMHHHF